MPTCVECKSPERKKYLLIPGTRQFICYDCFTKDNSPKSPSQPQHLPVFTRWVCKKHKCGSYNFNQLLRHEMPWCDIITEDTVGVIKPKTFGNPGGKGDLNRDKFPDWVEYSRRNDVDLHKMVSWNRYVRKHRINSPEKDQRKQKKFNPFKQRDPHAPFKSRSVEQVTTKAI